MPIDRTLDYQIRLDAIERARKPHVSWGHGLVLLSAGATCWWTLSLAQGPTGAFVLLGLMLILWACWPRRRPAGAPIPPKQMRKLLRRGKAYISDTHHILAPDGFYAYSPQTGHYELVPGAVDPLIAQQWVRKCRWARFWKGMLQGAWLSYVWRH